jgi:hypothetical protein
MRQPQLFEVPQALEFTGVNEGDAQRGQVIGPCTHKLAWACVRWLSSIYTVPCVLTVHHIAPKCLCTADRWALHPQEQD